MKKVRLSKLPGIEPDNTYILTLFKDSRVVTTETIIGLDNALIKGKKLKKKENAEYEKRL